MIPNIIMYSIGVQEHITFVNKAPIAHFTFEPLLCLVRMVPPAVALESGTGIEDEGAARAGE